MKKYIKALVFLITVLLSYSSVIAIEKNDINTLKLTWKNILLISDKNKNNINSQSNNVISQLRKLKWLEEVEIHKYDFNDYNIEEYLKNNNIKYLPAIIFSNSDINSNLNQYLEELPDNSWYSLNIWATFNPFEKISNRWFKILEKNILSKIKSNGHIKWEINTQLTWLLYSDLECPYCAKLHNEWTIKDITEKYKNTLNIMFKHFPLEFHKSAYTAAQILECSFDQKWTNIFYNLIEFSNENKNSQYSFLVNQAVKLWVDKEELNKCINSKNNDTKIDTHISNGKEYFWITGTPWNVIINNITWEYITLSWAYKTEKFEEIIDSLIVKDIKILELKIKYNNNEKILSIFKKVDSIILKLNSNKLSLLSKKINIIETRIKNKTDKNSLIMKDIILYINESINKINSNIVNNWDDIKNVK